MERRAVIGLVVAGAALLVAGAGIAWWLSAGAGPADVERTPSASVSASSTPQPDPTVAMQEQLEAYADACATPAATIPEHCGIVVPWAADLATLTGIAFRIERYPVIAVSPDRQSFDATGGILVATVTGTTRDGAPGTFTYRTDEWALRGDVAVEDDRTVLSVR
ncbi:hypothetical protein JNB62_07375 [Microbacterium jejuense]|uniref:LppP/LprE lipoprotein n=1 Tax=Microbacterium jejuense TaxID=1263637 RepID=A0ABS7HKM4_9MICO|nr:hypothetical protein [Microbacterium jejuense]MBW9093497.1 hypothetical protein [Microbacterium jejuense]